VPGAKESAVLVPLFHDAGGALHAVFTERRADLRRHAGEISFPGGRREPQDADLLATALRETHEEIGLPPERVELLGALQPTPTFVTDYAIYPFVGLIAPGFAWVLAEEEVGQVLELPLARLRAGHGRPRLIRRGLPFRTDVYDVDGHRVWGATARIVADLLDRIDEPGSAEPG
jgi:8-oxo-dGTP pyrophosphatase MutT (NUDIX family)